MTKNVTSVKIRHFKWVNGYLMVDVHELEDGGPVVGDGDVVVGRDHQLVQTLRTQRGSQSSGDRSGCHNVALKIEKII